MVDIQNTNDKHRLKHVQKNKKKSEQPNRPNGKIQYKTRMDWTRWKMSHHMRIEKGDTMGKRKKSENSYKWKDKRFYRMENGRRWTE